MEQFCGSVFWDIDLTWNTTGNPDFTYCYEETVLLWAPCAILWILTIPHVIYLLYKSSTTPKSASIDEIIALYDLDNGHKNSKNSNSNESRIKSNRNSDAALRKPIPWTVFSIGKVCISILFTILAALELGAILWRHYDDDNSHFSAMYPVHWVSPLLKMVTFAYLASIIVLYRRRAVYSSAGIFIFALLYVGYSAINARTLLMGSLSANAQYYPEFDSIYFSTRIIGTIFSLALLVLIGANEYTPDARYDPHRTSGFLGRITFWWFNSMIIRGYRRPLIETDMYRMHESNRSQTILADFDRKLDSMRTAKIIKRMTNDAATVSYQRGESVGDASFESRSNKSNKASSTTNTLNVAGVIWRVYWPMFVGVGVLKFIASCMTFGNPVILDLLMTFMSDQSGMQPIWRGYLYAAAMFAFPLLESVLNSQHDYWVNVIIMRVRTCMISMIYDKSLRLSTYGRRNYSSGEIVNIMSVDSQRLVDFLVYANMIWAAPLQFGIAIYLLWQQVGWASMAGLAFMIVLLPFNGWISNKLRGNQIKVMREKDKRTKLMNEILNGIKVLKLYAWETAFRGKITGLREYECEELKKIAYLSGFMFFAFSAAPFLVGLFTFAAYVLSGNSLDPNKAFVSLSLFNIIRLPMGMLPMLLAMGAMCLVSIRRINAYLNSEEVDEDAIRYLHDDDAAIRIRSGTFAWSRDGDATLHDIDLEVPHGKLIALVGGVGSGKSSLLSAILGDIEKRTGTINIDGAARRGVGGGGVAYVPQQAWIQNATLRKNVTFTNAYDEARYRAVIDACCMRPDIDILANGDQTEIGERGINLSGGQKQRISLARAVYADAAIYLLDDPLSAVDSHVGKRLFEDVISNRGMLRHTTRILATHRVSTLTAVDEIIVVKDGAISERGTMDQLIEQKGDFAEFVAEYLTEQFGESVDADEDNDAKSGSRIRDDTDERQASSNKIDVDDDELELMKSLAEKVKPILERTESRLSRRFSLSASTRTDASLSGDDDVAKKSSQKRLPSKTRKVSRQISSSINISTSARRRNTGSQQQLQQKPPQPPHHQQRHMGEDSKKIDAKHDGKLITAESSQTGSVKLGVYVKYFQTIGMLIFGLIVGSMVLSNVFQIFSSLWLSSWADDGLDPAKVNDTALRDKRLGVYAALGAGEIISSLMSFIVLNVACIQAAKVLHNEMLSCILLAPMAFFDTTPIGRILNRFTKDVDVADSSMVFNLRMGVMQFFRTIVAFIMISLEAPIILAAILPILVLYYLIQRVYIASSRQLKRLESTTRSPIYNHFSETVNGVSSIRAYGVQNHFIADTCRRIDHNNSCFYSSITASRWLAIRLEFFGYTIVFLAAIFAVISRGTLSPGLAGLAISYSLNITGVLGLFVRSTTDLETNIVSIERLIEYSDVKSEAPYYNEQSRPKKGSWPAAGEIEFANYSTRYRDGLELVARDVTFRIASQEKVGIVGRTGAGKSSITLALFRIIEPAAGRIVIDDIDITKLGLFDLRSRITIIPQDPVLFTGSLRMNLDPFDAHPDEEVWRALELAHLKSFVTGVDGQLDYVVTEGGENLSVGQRQLVCLARALLRKSKILVLDEATAAVDMETDELIQRTIRHEFADCTIMTIAHRLNTVIDYDRILVLDQGRVLEYDSPRALLDDKRSHFYSMAKDAKLV